MRPYRPLTCRSPIGRRTRRILGGLVLSLAMVLLAASPGLAQGKKKNRGQAGAGSSGGGGGGGGGGGNDQSLVNHWRNLAGPVEVRLVFTDSSGKSQDVSLVDATPELLKALPPRLQVESKLPLVQPKVWFFDGLWVENGAAICKEAAASVQRALPAGNDHEAYNVNGKFNIPLTCRPFKFAWMSADVDPSAPSYFVKYNSQGTEVIPAGGYPTNKVRQLQIAMSSASLNFVPFFATTPCTCHAGNAACNQDPRFTDFFEVTFTVVANSSQQDSWQFGPNPMMKIEYYAGQTLLGGKRDYEQEVAQLESSIEKQVAADIASLAATGDLSIVAVIGQFFADLFKYGIGGLFSATCNADLYNSIQASLSGAFNTPTLVQMAKTASDAFKTLFLALEAAGAVGFTNLDIVQGPHHNLVFKLTYPAPAKPDLQNAVAAANKGIHLQAPSISTGGGQIQPGVAFPVRGDNFLEQSTNGLEISWTKTVAGPPLATVLQWGPQGGHLADVKDPSLALGKFLVPKLQPNTTYQFRVHECDAISCAPWADLTTSTKKTGSNDVEITLDNDKAHPVGTGVIAPSGSFLVNATVPVGTAPGKHTLHAQPGASVEIVVAGKGGPGATISVIDSRTKAALPAPVPLLYPSAFMVRGSHFSPGAKVILHLDSPTGPKLGNATADGTGMFVGNFKLGMVTTGNHQLVAVEAGGGKKSLATEAVALASQPK